ncbi:RNA-guided endonuclease InsQ/TnpB family protein [Desulfurococcus mucosus]|uniref:Transposase, IS605 OrfB family n=1 Tax=Desulfurococcus mucosus (strain ATCC 35584 / DSM 2162 / JCM 9187 / O7/1) TaxID=765177 RepID=E8RAC8_DESM0|nr:RNA-guided endonuclease TnpB family protein [Desulfurococcus mucosus]ADV65434.1 transposase, IS605 OrfB family [Desulfurococcus mucosus DSM 2162]
MTSLLTRTVIVPSSRLGWRKFNALRELGEKYREFVVHLVEYGFKHGVKSFTGLKKAKYRELRERYPGLPSHYVHTACQDAAQRVRSFLALKCKGKAKTGGPEVRKVSIWLDDHLWKSEGYTAIKVATHRGWIMIPLWPTKLFWRYVNSGWRLRTQIRLKLDEKRRVAYVYFVFEKMVEERPTRSVIAVDLNENNVTVKAGDKVYILETRIRKITVGYHNRREILQSTKGNRYASRMVKRNEFNKKNDIRRKVASLIVREAERLGVAIAVENLPREAPKDMIKDVDDPKLRDRIYRAGFRSMVREIVQKAREKGIPVIKVNPRGTSSTCPQCGGRLVRGNAPRSLLCLHCGWEGGRDIAAVMNIERRALEKLAEGRVPFGPMPSEPTPEVAWLPMRAWARRKSLDMIEHKWMRMNI